MRTLKDLEKTYDIDFEKIIFELKNKKCRLILLQFADGLKLYATAVVDYFREKTNGKIEFLIWIESCFGACDTPILPKEIEKKIDLIVQIGHNELMPSYL